MWKDWFFFSRSQKIGILILIVIILALLAAKMVILSLPTRTEIKDNFETEARQFLDSLKQIPPTRYTQGSYYRNYANYNTGKHTQNLLIPVLSRFNPNTADSSQFVRLGIKPKIASNILKYRKKGGKFRKTEDFEKIWGISKEQMLTLLPYIDIPAEAPPMQAATPTRIAKTESIIEINSADTTLLQQVKGIGPGFARRIAGYRKRLGGFVRIEQLHEVWGMTSELYNSIASHFSINAKLIQPININKASLERLKYHPYLNFYKAKAIYELRLSKGMIKSLSELKQLNDIDKETLDKIAPYLSFQ